MRFHHAIATILVLTIIAGYAAAMADQIALARLQRALVLSFGEFKP